MSQLSSEYLACSTESCLLSCRGGSCCCVQKQRQPYPKQPPPTSWPGPPAPPSTDLRLACLFVLKAEDWGFCSQRAEDQVAQQTEEVFRSYAFYRYQQEREESTEEMPMDPEIAEIQQEPGSTSSLVGRRLAIIGDDINARYDAEFRNMLKSLQPTKDNAYEYFTRIASSLFDSGINWGRVIALLGFGYRMAIHVYQHGMTGFLRSIARYVADFVLCNRIARWIAQQGGWVAALDLDNVYLKYMMVVLIVVLLGQFVVRRFFGH
uniref:Bcl-2 homologous antagonist/killer n=1 Tax=Crocodylus porosus TaxID=8502 RepID=A0A7M4FYJ1_CROPO